MANVMEMRNIKNKPSYNGFDQSTSRLFTARAGEIMPVFCRLVLPGEKVELYPNHFTRTQPLNTAAYTRVTEQVNFFKVRLQHLHNIFDTYITSMFDNQQVASTISTSSTLSAESPYFTQYDLANFIYQLSVSKRTDELGYPLAPRVAKLLQYLGYGDFTSFVSNAPSSSVPSRRLSPFPILAYQKVYFDYFRYQQWENSSPWCFNINWANFGQSLGISSLLSNNNFSDCIFTPRYANFKKDYFLGVLPSPQYGDSSVIPVVSSSTPSFVDVLKSGTVNSWPTSGTPVVGSVIPSQLGNSIRSIVSNPSIISLRKAEAIQKLREIQQSGDQDYKAQIEKIFGVSVPDNESDLCEWLGGYDSNIDISEVVNTTFDNGQADVPALIKGKGTSSSQGKISFTSRDFSIIIGVYTAVPKLYYDLDVAKPTNTLVHIDDYPNPVIDRIGMQSMLWADVLGYGNDDWTAGGSNRGPGDTYGYATRYFAFKTAYDEVLGAFKSSANTSLQSWVTPFSDFLSRINSHGTNYLMFKVDPAILNPIFTAQIKPGSSFTSTPQSMLQYYNEEQFLVNMSIGDASVKPLDYDGLPYN